MKKILILLISFNLSAQIDWSNDNTCNISSNNEMIDLIVSNMTLEQKVGQVIMPDIDDVTPQEAKDYFLGSILNGGGKFPNKNKYSSIDDWKQLSQEFYNASPIVNEKIIPILWGTDAVHGHNNVIGATIFPHNIGLGAANNTDLMEKIGSAVAKEVLSTGIPWTFAPTIAVPQDSRWGRTYEGFSEDPQIVSDLGEATIIGLQGFGDNFLGDYKILATAKHFVGDGGTDKGVDQGNAITSEFDLKETHGFPYYAAIDACVQTIMASFNSWNGDKMHGSSYLLNDVLRDQMGFKGLVVGDWNGHGQLPSCTNKSCPEAFNAGVDIFMVPQDWKELYKNTLDDVKNGTISTARLDQAVKRILQVKYNIGLLSGKKHYEFSENFVGDSNHRLIARQAVRESLVLLKNNNKTLPIKSNKHILIIGQASKEIKYQMGGWTVSWQARDTVNTDYPNTKSIFEELSDSLASIGSTSEYSIDGSYKKKPDAVIFVYGEQPYAEGDGDRENFFYMPEDKNLINTMNNFKASETPTISLFLSGRPLIVNEELNASDAFVSLWLPGTAIEGISDVLLSNKDDSINYDFVGKLSYTWPKFNNAEKKNDINLFNFGYGLTYQDNIYISDLEVEQKYIKKDEIIAFLGSAYPPSAEVLNINWNYEKVTSNIVNDPDYGVSLSRFDYKKQDDARKIIFKPSKNYTEWMISSVIEEDISHMEQGQIEIELKVNKSSIEPLLFAMACTKNSIEINKSQSSICKTEIALSSLFKETQEWQKVYIPLSCFKNKDFNLSKVKERAILRTNGSWAIDIHSIKYLNNKNSQDCNLQKL